MPTTPPAIAMHGIDDDSTEDELFDWVPKKQNNNINRIELNRIETNNNNNNSME